MTTVEDEITAMVAEAFDDTIPRKRAVVRTKVVATMVPATGTAATTPTDDECWVLLDTARRSLHNDLLIEKRVRPWLIQGLTSAPRPGQELVIEGEGTGATFTHGGTIRTGRKLSIEGEPRVLSAGVGALWEVNA